MNADVDIQKYIAEKMPKVPTVDPIVEATIKGMRGDLGVKRLGGVGYCFGGKYVCRWLKEGSLDAGFTAHPSFVDAEELKGIKGPLSIAAAGMSHNSHLSFRHLPTNNTQHSIPISKTPQTNAQSSKEKEKQS
jgi:dienelactone hydrolase